MSLLIGSPCHVLTTWAPISCIVSFDLSLSPASSFGPLPAFPMGSFTKDGERGEGGEAGNTSSWVAIRLEHHQCE